MFGETQSDFLPEPVPDDLSVLEAEHGSTEPPPYDEPPEAAVDGILGMFERGAMSRGEAETCIAGALEAGFVLVPLDAALAARLVRYPDGHWDSDHE